MSSLRGHLFSLTHTRERRKEEREDRKDEMRERSSERGWEGKERSDGVKWQEVVLVGGSGSGGRAGSGGEVEGKNY